MATITFYQKPTCTTCRKVKAELEESGSKYESVNYYEQPLTKAKLKELLVMLKMPASQLLRKKEPIYRELQLGTKDYSEDEILALMVKHPDLIERPIVVKGKQAILARPAETIREFI